MSDAPGVKITAYIRNINTKTCGVMKFDHNKWEHKEKYWDRYQSHQQNIEQKFMNSSLVLKYDSKVIDKLIENTGLFTRLTIKNGIIINVEESPITIIKLAEEADQFLNALDQLQSMTVNKEIKAILYFIEKEDTVSKQAIHERFSDEMSDDYIIKVLSSLMRSGTIYMPRPDYFRVTD